MLYCIRLQGPSSGRYLVLQAAKVNILPRALYGMICDSLHKRRHSREVHCAVCKYSARIVVHTYTTCEKVQVGTKESRTRCEAPYEKKKPTGSCSERAKPQVPTFLLYQCIWTLSDRGICIRARRKVNTMA